MTALGPTLVGQLVGRHPTSRRVSAGVHPSPGATSRLPVWWSSTDWVENEVAPAVREHADVCRAHHVAPDTVVAVATGMSVHADHRTGRDCRPTNERLVEELRLSLSTVQRARRVLKELRLVVELVAGRSVMTRLERIAAWSRHSRHRRIAAEFALCSLGRRRPAAKINSQADLHVVDRDTPPVGEVVRAHLSEESGRHQAKTGKSDEERAPRAAPTSEGRRRAGHDPASRRLAEGVRGRLVWLRDTSPARMTPTLHRFAQAGWRPSDVDQAVGDRMRVLGRRVPRTFRTTPAAFLAWVLRDVDPGDRPGAVDQWMADVEHAERAYLRQLEHGHPCDHGVPGGHVVSPRGALACPLCRAAAVQPK